MKKLLVVVDYQNDFVEGSLGFEEAKELDSIIVGKIKSYREANHDVIFTLDSHGTNYLSTEEGRHLPVEHCIEDTWGHKIYGETAKNTKDSLLFMKTTFGSDKLFYYLSEHPYDVVELCGLVLGICVLSNAVLAKTALPEAKIIVDAMASVGNDKTFDLKVLQILKGIHVEILNPPENI